MFRRLRQAWNQSSTGSQRLEEGKNDGDKEMSDTNGWPNGTSPIRLRSNAFERQQDGSIKLSVTLDKDQVECCVCYSSMTNSIFRCQGRGVYHNICGKCEWQLRRMKNANGHTKSISCPVCKTEGSFTRNLGLERQLCEISQNCPNSKYGCEWRHFPWDDHTKQEHQDTCIYGEIKCPECAKTIPGGRSGLIAHFRGCFLPSKNSKIALRKNSSQNLSSSSEHQQNQQQNQQQQQQQSGMGGPQINSHSHTSPQPSHLTHPQNLNPERRSSVEDSSGQVEMIRVENECGDRELDDDELIDNESKMDTESMEGSESCVCDWHEVCLEKDGTTQHVTFELTHRNTIVVNEAGGYILVFRVLPNSNFWEARAFAISPLVQTIGNTTVYLRWTNLVEEERMRDYEAKAGPVGSFIVPPVSQSASFAISKLQSANEDNSIMTDAMGRVGEGSTIGKIGGVNPAQVPQTAYIFCGNTTNPGPLKVRTWTLPEIVKVGSVVDARDFTGKWYEAEILKVAGQNENETASQGLDLSPLSSRRAKVHYLGYSANYDEWINFDTDCHRVAHLATHTVGPNLRTRRRYSAQRNERNERSQLREQPSLDLPSASVVLTSES